MSVPLTCLGYEAGSFVEAYKENRKLATSHVLEGSPVAKAIISLMESRDTWSGTHTNPLSDLEDDALTLKINIQRDSSWPKGANALSRKLPYIKDNLEEVGIFMHTTEDTKTKLKTIILCKISPESSEPSDKSKSSTDYVDPSDDIGESTNQISPEISPDQSAEKRAQIQDSDDSSGSDGILQHTKAPSDYSCEYCSKHFDSEDLRVRLSVSIHKGWSAYPGPADLEKYREVHQVDKKNRVADIAHANLGGNGVLESEPDE